MRVPAIPNDFLHLIENNFVRGGNLFLPTLGHCHMRSRHWSQAQHELHFQSKFCPSHSGIIVGLNTPSKGVSFKLGNVKKLSPSTYISTHLSKILYSSNLSIHRCKPWNLEIFGLVEMTSIQILHSTYVFLLISSFLHVNAFADTFYSILCLK